MKWIIFLLFLFYPEVGKEKFNIIYTDACIYCFLIFLKSVLRLTPCLFSPSSSVYDLQSAFHVAFHSAYYSFTMLASSSDHENLKEGNRVKILLTIPDNRVYQRELGKSSNIAKGFAEKVILIFPYFTLHLE